MLLSLLLSLLFIAGKLTCSSEPLRSWYPYHPQSMKQRRESNFAGFQSSLVGEGLEISACPTECRCFAKTVRCSSKDLKDLPRNLPLDTERIIISHASISRLDKNSFLRLPAVTQIVLSHNNISEIEDGTFEGVQNLQYLDLRQNNLRCLYDGTFQGLKNLRVLRLDQNKISWISRLTFNSLSALQWLTLNDNPLQCDCHLVALMKSFIEEKRQSVFSSSGAICDRDSKEFPGDVAAEVLGLLYCPHGVLPLIPPICKRDQEPRLSSCQSVCACDTSGFVSCVGKSLDSVPSDLPENLISLNIANNQLTHLPKNAFSRYSSLRKLNLEENKITNVSPWAFSGLHRLSSLYLTGNQIQSFPRNAFKGLSSLTILNLQKNNISCIDGEFFDGLTNLRILHLSENAIDTIEEDAFKSLKQLRYLYLINNKLNCDCSLNWLPEFLKQNEAGGSQWTTCHMPTSLKGQYVRDIKLQPCVSAERKRHCKRDADLQHQSIPQQDLDMAQNCPKACTCSRFPNRVQRSADDVITFTALRPRVAEIVEPSLKVTCTNAGLTSVPIGIPENTKELYLDHNSIGEVNHESFAHLKKLEVLSLHHNQLSYLHNGTFAALPRLKVLQLHSNRIQCIGSSAFDIESLKLVSFDDNPFKCGPQMSWLGDWMQLNQALVMASPSVPACASPAHLKGSPLVSLSAGDFYHSNGNSTEASCESDFCSNGEVGAKSHCPDPCACKNQRVDCSGRALKEIPKDLPSETRDLFLEHNAIKSIDSERLRHLKSLETLLLSHNKILEITPDAFKDLSNLKSLVLSGNGLRCIHPDAFSGLKQLKVLILQNNDISILANGTFRELEQMNNLALGQNPLHCDCNLRWLHDYFRLKSLDNGVSICASPERMKFKSIFHSTPKDFLCLVESPDIITKCSPCARNPCLNGGGCGTISGVEFNCTCEMPFYGDRCEKKVDACFKKPCKNGGTCDVTDDLGHYRCKCPTGFTGLDCELNVDDCKNVTCENGGVCIDGVNNYICECAPGFRGEHCENEFQYCVDENPCQNDGVCVIQKPTGFKCVCPDGWGGNDCSKNLDDCEYNKCQNGGACVDQIGGYTCDCLHGFTGRYCEVALPSQITAMQNSASFGCAYNRCLNAATCQPDISPIGYRCLCPFDVHVAVPSPSRGCFLPRGNISLTFSTSHQQGILFFFSEMINKTLLLRRFLIAELHQGHVKISFAIDAGEVGTAYSMSMLADNKLHRLDVVVVTYRVEMYVDGSRNALTQSIVSTLNPSKFKPRALISAAPIYLGGAPKRLLKSASRAGVIGATSGVVACIESLYINDKAMEFSQALRSSSSLKPGCEPPTSSRNSLTIKPNFKVLHPRSKMELIGQHDAAIVKDSVIASDCRSRELACLNGGICNPEYGGNDQGQQWTSTTLQHVCRCPSGFEGVKCETPIFCKRHSRYSYIYDPDTGCISTRRIVIRSCSGSCQGAAGTSLMWQLEQQQRKRRWRKKARRRVRRHRSQWTSLSPPLMPKLSRMPRSVTENTGTCCQPMRFKQKSVQFQCPKNGSGNRVYSRWFHFVRKCGCATNCHNRDGSTTDGIATDAF
ncbi:Slit -like protein 2 protein [Echinococcus granulosus]|nr:Slit -like protein 2 protein [Echinococcus granulosus]